MNLKIEIEIGSVSCLYSQMSCVSDSIFALLCF